MLNIDHRDLFLGFVLFCFVLFCFVFILFFINKLEDGVKLDFIYHAKKNLSTSILMRSLLKSVEVCILIRSL